MTENEPQNIPAIDSDNVEVNQESFYPDLSATVVLFFVFILNSIMVGIPAGILIIGLNTVFLKSPLLISLFNFLLYVAPVLITIKYVVRKSKERQGFFSRICFNKIQWWLVPVIIVGTLALVILLARLSTWIPMPKFIQKLFENPLNKGIMSIIIAILVAPVLEEILCRGIVLRGLLKNYPPFKAILISAIFFGAIHLNPWQGIPATFDGLFLGWVYYKTQSVIPGMIIHAAINITAVSFLFLPRNQQDFISLLGLPHYLLLCLISIIIFAAVCTIIQKKIIPIPMPTNKGFVEANALP